MKNYLRLLLFSSFFVAFSLSAQEKFKFGKIDKEDLAMTVLPSDSSAGAYVLHHSSTVFYDLEARPTMIQTVNRRVKLLQRSGFDEADVALYYRPETEILSDIKAEIHLPSGESIRVKSKDMLRDDYSDQARILKFTFPQVTEGAIIEYTYRLSDVQFGTLPKFYFQEEIPVRYAEFVADIPEYYRYVSLSNAHQNWSVSEDELESRILDGEPLRVRHLRYVKTDVPAFREQPYSNNMIDYLPQTYLQLQEIAYPTQPAQRFITTWPGLARSLDDYTWFGRKFNNLGDVRKPLSEIEPLVAEAESEMDKATIAYRHIGQHMNWNESYQILGHDPLNVCWDKASGNSAEINMILLGVLKALDIEAQPILVSLRDRGAHITAYPIYDQFDHLMVLATLDGKETILDIGDPDRSVGLPRFEALNGQGWVADPDGPRWITLTVPQMTRTVMADITIGEDGLATVGLKARMKGYYAFSGRNRLQKQNSDAEGPLMVDIVKKYPEAILTDRTVNPNRDPYEPLSLELTAEIPLAMAADDYLYVSPVVIHALEKGLRDTEERLAPVDMGYAWKERYIGNIQVPEGYVLESLPESQKIHAEDGSVHVSYTAAEGDGEVVVNFTVELDKAIFSAGEYQGLREIFARAIDLQEAVVVFKKVK